MTRKKLVVANWKCNGGAQLVASYLKAFVDAELDGTELVVCPPTIFLSQLQALAQENVSLGVQDLGIFEDGPYTGNISSELIFGCGGTWTLIGHSERRTLHKESQVEILQKLQLPFLTLSPDFDETPLKDETPQDLVIRLAEGKA